MLGSLDYLFHAGFLRARKRMIQIFSHLPWRQKVLKIFQYGLARWRRHSHWASNKQTWCPQGSFNHRMTHRRSTARKLEAFEINQRATRPLKEQSHKTTVITDLFRRIEIWIFEKSTIPLVDTYIYSLNVLNFGACSNLFLVYQSHSP